mgnify:CR=1 FL=1
MHVSVRLRVAENAEWDSARWGLPISQAEMMLTLLGGSVGPALGLYSLGYVTSPQEIRAVMHFNRYLGHLVGVQSDVFPGTVADGVLVTGPGQAERSILPGNPRVLSIAQFWHRAAGHERITAERVVVIGGGESAAAILNELFAHRVSTITVISPQVTLFTRGEGFFENSLFSDPTHWAGLTSAERRDAIARTDRGVFSARVQESLLADDRIRHLRGRVAHAVARDEQIRLTLHSDRAGEPSETVHGFDLVIDGSGADTLWFTELFSQDALDLIELGLGGPMTGERLAESIGHDLSVEHLTPKLFLPNLSGLNQGPGFPNLSCLGLLSDRVLGSDLAAPHPTRRRTDEHQSVRRRQCQLPRAGQRRGTAQSLAHVQ